MGVPTGRSAYACDGYYWPITFATTRSSFARDRDTCERTCGSPARLFVHPSSGGSPETMVDLGGQPYTRLRTAFQYRTTYDASCKCTPEPWTSEAVDQHRVYALEAAARKGDPQAGPELTALKSKLADARRQQAERKKAENDRLVAAGVVTAASSTGSGALVPAAPSRSVTVRPSGIMGLGVTPDTGSSGSGGGGGYGNGERSTSDWRASAFRGH